MTASRNIRTIAKKTSSTKATGNGVRPAKIHALCKARAVTPSVVDIIVSGLIADGVKYIQVIYQGVTAYLLYAMFAGPMSAIFRELGSRGIVLISKGDRKDLEDKVRELTDWPERFAATSPGWCGPHFVFPDGDVISRPGIETPAVLFPSDPTKCVRAGSRLRWRRAVARPLARHPIPIFAIMVMFAPFILPLTDRADNFSFEFVGRKGTGKSTIILWAASAQGGILDDGKGRYWINFDTTRAGVETMIESHSGSAILLDETNTAGDGKGQKAQARALIDFAFQVAAGNGRSRYKAVANESHRVIAMLSANQGVTELAANRSGKVTGAASDRLISIPVDHHRPHGVFERVPRGYASLGAFADTVKRAAAENHGTAAPAFVQRLVESRSQNDPLLRKQVADRLAGFRKLVRVSENDGSATRIADAFGIVAVAGRLAQRFGILPRSLDCMAAAAFCYEAFPRWCEIVERSKRHP